MQCHKCVLPKHPAPFFHTFIVLWILMHDIIMHCGEHFMSCYRNKLFCISFIYFRRYYWPFGSWSALVKIKANKQRFPNMVVWFWAKFPCNGFPPIFFAQNPIQLHRVLSPTCLIGGSPVSNWNSQLTHLQLWDPAWLVHRPTQFVFQQRTSNIEQQWRQIVGKWASAGSAASY